MVERSGERWRLYLHSKLRTAAAFLAANKSLLTAA
jgi:hypothetical protein